MLEIEEPTVEGGHMAITRTRGVLDDLAAAWTEHDIDKLLSICTDDCIYEDVTMAAVNRGKAEVKVFGEGVLAAFPDFKLELSSGFILEKAAAAEWTMSGTHKGDLPGLPATGKPFTVRGASICELREGKISRISDYWDMAAFLKQIGLMA